MPGFGTILSCRCFAYEECGNYAAAEPSGWAALEIDPADFWGIHAVAHVMEMVYGHEKSDLAIVAVKPANKAAPRSWSNPRWDPPQRSWWSEGRGPRGMRTSKARPGHRA
jgi:hypothetical protein